MMTEDHIFVHGLEVETCIGVYEWERTKKRTLVLDFEIAVDVRDVAAEDSVHAVVDYDALSTYVRAYAQHMQVQLIETFAERLVDALLQKFPITRIQCRLVKPHALAHARRVGVVIVRERHAAVP